MNQKIFVNKYSRIKELLQECLPQDIAITFLEQDCVIIDLPRGVKRKSVMETCRAHLDEAQRVSLQSVNHIKVVNNRIEISLPGIKRFLKKR